jgi:hypothetical protein
MSASDRQLLAEMHQAMDEASRIVLGGGRDEVFEGGCLVGVTVGIGLALANCIKERALCDAWAQTGHGTEYQRHLARAQAFEELADKLRQWHAEHPPTPPSPATRSESDVPDSVPEELAEHPIILLTLGMELPDGTLREVVQRVPLYAVNLTADGHAALYKTITVLAKNFMANFPDPDA